MRRMVKVYLNVPAKLSIGEIVSYVAIEVQAGKGQYEIFDDIKELIVIGVKCGDLMIGSYKGKEPLML